MDALIKVIFFDYDGVLTMDKTGSLTTHRYVSQAAGLSLAEVQAAFRRHNQNLTLGKTTHAQVWPEVCEALACSVSLDMLLGAFESTPVNAAMFSLARRLKGNYALGIITDNKKDRIDHLKKHQGLELLFDPTVVSAEVGSSKEDPAIFRHALRYLDVLPEECVFIDNSRDNLIAPGALGMKTVFHDDEKNDVQALARTLSDSFGVVLSDAA